MIRKRRFMDRPSEPERISNAGTPWHQHDGIIRIEDEPWLIPVPREETDESEEQANA